MSSPKKKLPTGPIRIDTDVSQLSASSSKEMQALATQPRLENESPLQIQETIKQDSSILENNLIKEAKQDSGLPEGGIAKTSILTSGSQDGEFLEVAIEESAPPDSTPEVEVPDLGNLESRILESTLGELEYKKVAMRLSTTAVENLRQLRATTGVPYEILVDVMICNWDKLPARTRTAYLQQAKQIRVERLMAGQEKTMKTMRDKYLK